MTEVQIKQKAEEFLIKNYCNKSDEYEEMIKECNDGIRSRCYEFEEMHKLLADFATEVTKELQKEVEDWKTDHEYNLELMKGSNELIKELKKTSIVWHKVVNGDLPKRKGIFLFRDFYVKENRYINYGVTNVKDDIKDFDEWAEIPTFKE